MPQKVAGELDRRHGQFGCIGWIMLDVVLFILLSTFWKLYALSPSGLETGSSDVPKHFLHSVMLVLGLSGKSIVTSVARRPIRIHQRSTMAEPPEDSSGCEPSSLSVHPCLCSHSLNVSLWVGFLDRRSFRTL